MLTAKELRLKQTALVAAADAIFAKAKTENRSMNEAEQKDFDAKMDEADKQSALILEAEKREQAQHAADELRAERLRLAGQRVAQPVQPVENRVSENYKEKRNRILATAQLSGNLKNFPNDKDGRYRAYRFGIWCLAAAGAVFGRGQRAQRFCKENGLYHQAPLDAEERAAIGQQENINYAGGYLVPDEFNNDMIVLRETYGVFRPNAKKIPMKGDMSSRPRRRGGLTAYFVGEGAAGTASTKPWDVVSLAAKKVMCLALYSSELNEDAVINIGDDLAGEIAYAFSKLEDQCGFVGDGTSTYGGMLGLHGKFTAIAAGTIANAPNIKQTSGGSWALSSSGIVIGDVIAMMAKLPQYADTPACAFYCHKTFFHAVLQGLAVALTGNRVEEAVAKMPQQFLGYPVKFTQVMPSAYVTKTFPLYFGDLSLAADFGDRRETSIAFSNSATIGSTNAFAQDALAIRGTERFDINVHDVGYNSAVTPASNILQVNGPIVALYTA